MVVVEIVFVPCFANEVEGASFGDTAGEGGARLSFVDICAASLLGIFCVTIGVRGGAVPVRLTDRGECGGGGGGGGGTMIVDC